MNSIYQQIAIVTDGSAEADRALHAATAFAVQAGAALKVMIVQKRAPVSTAFAEAAGPGVDELLRDAEDSLEFSTERQIRSEMSKAGIAPEFHRFEENDIHGAVAMLKAQNIDLVVVGLRPRGPLLSRLWRGIYSLAEEAPCSVLGVH